jgi:hypothetical protein
LSEQRVAKVLDERGNRALELIKCEQANRMLKINIFVKQSHNVKELLPRQEFSIQKIKPFGKNG